MTVAGSTPVFLIGAFAGSMRADLGLSLSLVGLAVASYRACGGVLARPLGVLADRIGADRGMALAMVLSAISSALVAALVTEPAGLIACMALTGAAGVLGQTSATLLFARRMAKERLGVSLAVQLSALPIGAALAGVLLPLLGTERWRLAFAAHAATALLLAGLASLGVGAAEERRGQSVRHLSASIQFGLSAVLALGMMAATPLAAFVVETATASGLSARAGGGLLVAGSALTILVRVSSGHAADRGIAPLGLCALLLFGGSAGYGLLAVGSPAAVVAGAVLSFGLGWSFVGLLFLAVLRLRRGEEGAALGATLRGGLIGGMAGPAVFGLVADRLGLGAAWVGAGALAGLAGGLTLLIRGRIARSERASDERGLPAAGGAQA